MVYSDRAEIRDSKGTLFKNDVAAVKVARAVIDDLHAARQPEDTRPTIVVTNEASEVVYRFPSN